jgi:hypothetical protein
MDCCSRRLLKEPVEKKRRKTGKLYVRPVADCVKERDLENEQNGNPNHEPNWQAWLREWRIELNAVTPPQFVEWINTQFEKHGAVKTIPPEELASQHVADIIESRIADSARKDAEFERRKELDTLQKKIEKVTKELEKKRSKMLEEIDEKVAKLTKERWEEIELPTGAAVVDKIKLWLIEYPHSHWRNSICSVATDIFSTDPTDEQREAQ